MEDLEKSKDVLVYQSNKLIEASYKLRIGQQKFLRLMASRIKKDDEDFKEYYFRIADVMELFDTKSQKSYTEITRQLKELMGNVLTFKVGKTTTLVPFLAFAQQDEGSGIVKVMFHPFLKPLYLNLNRENPFTVYELSNALKLRSTYSLRVYELLKQYQKLGHREITIEHMRTMFDLQPDEYERYNDFKRKVILQAQKEINGKTDIVFDFEEIKTGRKVTSIKFNIKSNRPKTLNEISVTSLQPEEDQVKDIDIEKGITEVLEILKGHKLRPSDALEIYKNAKCDIQYIKKVYEYSKTQDVDNLIGFMKKMVIPGVLQEKIKTSKVGTFNNYEQRSYDFGKLEWQLLGWEKSSDSTGEEFEQAKIFD
jgi:plasmid replication initiation protein